MIVKKLSIFITEPYPPFLYNLKKTLQQFRYIWTNILISRLQTNKIITKDDM